MDFSLDTDQEMLRDTVHRFVVDRVLPGATEWNRQAAVPRPITEELAALGLWGIVVPPEWDGVGLGPIELTLVAEELARGDSGLAARVVAHNGWVCPLIEQLGSGVLQEQYLKPLATGGQTGALVATLWGPPGPTTFEHPVQAKRDGSGWRLRGKVAQVTNGATADILVVPAATEDNAWRYFVVDSTADGVARSADEDGLGLRTAAKATVSLDDVPVTEDQILNRSADPTSIVEEIGLAALPAWGAISIGLGRATLDAAVSYALERKQFGRPIADFQAIQGKLANMATELEAAALLIAQAAWQAGTGRADGRLANQAVQCANSAAGRAADHAVQVHGGFGYTTDFPVERHYRDARVLTREGGHPLDRRRAIARGILEPN